jgi:hypothetical protein
LPNRLSLRAETCIAPVRPTRFLPPILSPLPKAARFNPRPQVFQMIQHILRRLAGKNDREFFATATVSAPSAGYFR